MKASTVRKDGRFTRIPSDKVLLIREAKCSGCSLQEIANMYQVCKSTASLYCRDLFYDSQRIYETEEKARLVIYLRGIGEEHSIYKHCLDCGKTIRNEHTRCLKCNLAHQVVTGVTKKLALGGVEYQFRTKEIIKRKIPNCINHLTRIHNYRRIWDAYLATGYGAFRLSRILDIPLSTTSDILSKIRRNRQLIGS